MDTGEGLDRGENDLGDKMDRGGRMDRERENGLGGRMDLEREWIG